MIKVPHFLYTKEIINTIKGYIRIWNAEDFDSLLDSAKNILIQHALIACENDIEIVLSRDTNKCFSTYNSSTGLFALLQSMQQDYYDHFSDAFNFMFHELIAEMKKDRADDMRWAS